VRVAEKRWSGAGTERRAGVTEIGLSVKRFSAAHNHLLCYDDWANYIHCGPNLNARNEQITYYLFITLKR